MTEHKKLTCIVCPNGCELELTVENGKLAGVAGGTCKRGAGYAEAEFTHPVRTLTTTVRVTGGLRPLASVRSARPVPKELLFRCMEVINGRVPEAPVRTGDVVVRDILGTGVDIVATCDVETVQNGSRGV